MTVTRTAAMRILAIAALIGLAACGDNAVRAAKTPVAATAVQASPEASPASHGAPQTSAPADTERTPFDRETVVKLNEIVGRSLAAIREYDGSIDEIRAQVEAGAAPNATPAARAAAQTALASLESLHERASVARDDLSVASTALKASGRYYDPVVLGGMTEFVERVERELKAEKVKLGALLAPV